MLQEINDKKVVLADKKQELMQEYIKDLPTYLDKRLTELANKIAGINKGEGLSVVEINSLIRPKEMYGSAPKYSNEELAIIFEYYMNFIVLANKNMKYTPSLKNFCAFAGITSATYKKYLQSEDEARREVMTMIDDYLTDTMLSSAQHREIDNISTMFRTKTEHGMVEATAPIVIEHKTEIDLDKIQKQLAQLRAGKSLKPIELLKPNDYTIE